MTTSLLFIDVLGTRARWQAGGRAAAVKFFESLRDVVVAALQQVRPADVVAGGIESDSAVVVCKDARTAVALGRAIFNAAFRRGNSATGPRLWLRGVIVPYRSEARIRNDRPLSAEFAHVAYSQFADSLLEAIAVEKAGFQGMRLLIGGGLSDREANTATKIRVGPAAVKLVRRIRGATYPAGVSGHFRDVLWMAVPEESDWEEQKAIIGKRIRWALSNREELAHAGATQALFNVCGAVMGGFRVEHGLEGDAG